MSSVPICHPFGCYVQLLGSPKMTIKITAGARPFPPSVTFPVSGGEGTLARWHMAHSEVSEQEWTGTGDWRLKSSFQSLDAVLARWPH